MKIRGGGWNKQKCPLLRGLIQYCSLSENIGLSCCDIDLVDKVRAVKARVILIFPLPQKGAMIHRP